MEQGTGGLAREATPWERGAAVRSVSAADEEDREYEVSAAECGMRADGGAVDQADVMDSEGTDEDPGSGRHSEEDNGGEEGGTAKRPEPEPVQVGYGSADAEHDGAGEVRGTR